MNFGEIKIRVQRLFGDESGAQIEEADILRWANDAQLDIARHTEILKKHAETNVIAEDGSFTLPDDIIALHRVTYEGKILYHTTLERIDEQYPNLDEVASGTPGHYYSWGNLLYIHPRPNVGSTGTLDIWYVKSPVPLVDSTSVSELPAHMHEEIVRYCVARAKELDEDWQAAQILTGDYQARLAQAKHETNAKQENSYPAVRLLPGDEW